ncbi:MAG: adenylyltransferase/cytidyltransferase family protein [Bacteroidaceae bacterium]|nr:adenylyltransferase/cytidyltransferase family protein [Bacteroidaceae bacterium]
MVNKKVFVSGCYDLLHSGHVEFFRQASQYGDLYVGIGSDETIFNYKHHRTMYPEQERLFMVKAIRYVKDAVINSGSGIMDFIPTVDALKPDVFVVNEDGSSPEKETFCKERGIEYVVLERTPSEGLEARSSTSIKAANCTIPTRLDLAGTWIDQPYVSRYGAGWAITISLEPTFEVRERCGLSTSTRNMIKKIWPLKLPDMDEKTLAKLVFCFENDPERNDGIISGAQDSIGICMSGLVRHYYDRRFWPDMFESCHDEDILQWLESHLCMVPMHPRQAGCSVVEGCAFGSDAGATTEPVTKEERKQMVAQLTSAAERCWRSIMKKDLSGFAQAYKDSFNAQVTMFPAMVEPVIMDGDSTAEPSPTIKECIRTYSAMPDVLAWKMPGAGGGGYLALVVRDANTFTEAHPEAISLKIRRKNTTA